MRKAKGRKIEGVDWLRGRLRWEDRMERLRREAGVPVPGPAAGGFIAPVTPGREPVVSPR